MNEGQQAAPKVSGDGRTRARCQEGLRQAWVQGTETEWDSTCSCIHLEPSEVDGSKATAQGENQKGKQAANFHSKQYLHLWGAG